MAVVMAKLVMNIEAGAEAYSANREVGIVKTALQVTSHDTLFTEIIPIPCSKLRVWLV